MGILRFFESIRMPVLNEFMLLVTEFGGEIAFLVTAIVVFWCFDKRHGYFIMSVGFIGTIISQFMKLWFHIPRPWVKQPGIAMEQAIGDAGGYSFPSGHSQSSVGTFGGLAYIVKNKGVRWVCIAIAILVPLSRMYVGVHTPLDVAVGSALSLLLIFSMHPVVYSEKKFAMPVLIAIMTLISIGHLCYVEFFPFSKQVDTYNLEHGMENAYTMFGCVIGMIVVYILDERWLNFSTKAVWWAQILKVAGGLAVIMAVKIGAKTPLNFLLGPMFGRAARYFLIVIIAGVIWPLTFRYFGKLGLNEKN